MGQQLREELHDTLAALLGDTNRVYFQPNENTLMEYPCITYERDNGYRAPANNLGYIIKQRYLVKLISRDPDNPILDDVMRLPLTSYSRGYVADGLTHDALVIYH